MSRKGEKRKWTDCENGRSRRSPRLTSSTHPANVNSSDKQSASKSKESRKQEHHLRQTDESWLPEKHLLELVLDTLQRRDSYDIFAEPVDPSEVEEYYEIISEPMDFGTMRAKLHEGLYKNLRQFEHDMYLIFDNAMYFNPSGTVYFRQARALEDLAKKVFHALKTNPGNFEREFPATKRRPIRKLDEESRGSTFYSGQKVARDLGSNGMSTDPDIKGGRKQRRPFMSDIDRRCTYNPWKSVLEETDSTILPFTCDVKPLIHVNPENTGYIKSLMSFVKDLGPTAQRVAERKLHGLWPQTTTNKKTNNTDSSATNPQIPTSGSNSQTDLTKPFYPSMSLINSRHIQQQTDISKSKEAPDKGKPVKPLISLRSTDANETTKSRKSDPVSKGTVVMGLIATRDRYHRNSSVSRRVPVKESNPDRVCKFDLNQAHPIPTSSHAISHFKDNGVKLRAPQLEPLATSNLSKVSNLENGPMQGLHNQVHNIAPWFPMHFFYNVPHMESRLTTNVPIALQQGSNIGWPPSNTMRFIQGSNSHGYSGRNGLLDINQAPSGQWWG